MVHISIKRPISNSRKNMTFTVQNKTLRKRGGKLLKKANLIVIVITLSILLFSCSNETEIVEIPTIDLQENPIVFKNKEQEFKIYTYYEEFEKFLESAKDQPDKLDELYEETIVKPVSSDLGLHRLNHWMLSPPKNVEAMEQLMENLNEKKTVINELVIEALKESSDLLPGENKFIYVLPSTPQNKSMLKKVNYVTGEAFNKYTMIILVDPSFLDIDIKHTIAHEYHHLVAMESEVGDTLLERVVLEGKAEAFSKNLYPSIDVPWVKPLTGHYKEESWKIFNENLNSVDYGVWADFFYGNRSKGILPWTSYKIGFQIMENFLIENPDISIEEWTRMPAKEIYTKSNLMVKE